MNILFLAAEAQPFAKTGGLADVAGSLPAALARLGHRVALMLPAYRTALARADARPTGLELHIPVGDRVVTGTALRTSLPRSEVAVYLIDQPGYFDRPGIYGDAHADYPDNAERFVFFQRAALETARQLDLRPEIVHGNDWQTGLVPAYLDHVYRPWAGSGFRRTASVQTIHNLAYQGSFDPADMALTGLDPRLFASGLLEAMGRLNFLKSGLVTADAVTTVSPTYAREIQTPAFGRYLDAVLRDRAAAGDLVGIVNGIDPAEWGPAADPHLVARYDFETHEAGKAACKADLQRRAGLHERPTIPLVAVIGRLDAQKGWDLLLWAADALMARELQFVVLGTGSHHYQAALADLVSRYPGRAHAFLEFSEPMAHRITAGADFVLMPSLYEPCGLIQLHGLAYGTIPIARETGGLADTIVDATPEALASGRATGILFRDADANGLLWAVDRALGFHHDPAARRSLIRAGMARDWSWDRSAREYTALYERLADRRAARSAPAARAGAAPAA